MDKQSTLHNVQSYSNGPQVTAARPSLQSYIGEHSRLIGLLHEVIGDLTSRMNPIMQPRPEAGPKPAEAGTAYSSLAQEIESQNYQLSLAIARIRDLYENIDL